MMEVPQEILDRVEAIGNMRRRQWLTDKHGEERAEEILLSEKLGDLKYVMDEEVNGDESYNPDDEPMFCGFG